VNYFVSLNAESLVDPALIRHRIAYTHPLFDLASIRAQRELPALNRISPDQSTYFAGSYFRYGFHEDALASALAACEHLLQRDPWSAA
jgi:predicted NAD/FAD-binding protein